jgi:chromosomal replication initiator protein
MVQKAVAEFFKIPLSDLRAKKRNKNIVLPRQIAMYLSRELSNVSFPEIGNAFGGKDHTTALYSYKKIEKNLSNPGEEGLKNIIRELTLVLSR